MWPWGTSWVSRKPWHLALWGGLLAAYTGAWAPGSTYIFLQWPSSCPLEEVEREVTGWVMLARLLS